MNCVSLAACGKGRAWFAACVTTRADVNRVVKRQLGASKISFVAVDSAVGVSGMEYRAMAPLGLPAGWPLRSMKTTVLARVARPCIVA